ncbi:hypothetical protein GOODEAATRI_005544 [Goodea atripinnis]|uniref:Uncharacterized protein n=1 Tax=Goodea atripinnis TaxID=208336 RepID=A0ABV0MH95_9TELE
MALVRQLGGVPEAWCSLSRLSFHPSLSGCFCSLWLSLYHPKDRPALRRIKNSSLSSESFASIGLFSARSREGLSAAWVPRDPLPECGESSGRDPRDMNHTKGGLVIFTANSHPSNRELGKRIAE